MDTAEAEINVTSIELLQWIDDETAELAVHTDEGTMARWKHVFDEAKRKRPFAEPTVDEIFAEYWADKGTVVYWLDADDDEPYMLTDEIGSEKLDKLVIDAATNQQQA